ncbi:hypothetical protein [Aerococcus vaginalis]
MIEKIYRPWVMMLSLMVLIGCAVMVRLAGISFREWVSSQLIIYITYEIYLYRYLQYHWEHHRKYQNDSQSMWILVISHVVLIGCAVMTKLVGISFVEWISLQLIPIILYGIYFYRYIQYHWEKHRNK